jgi:virginiamycin B lyase
MDPGLNACGACGALPPGYMQACVPSNPCHNGLGNCTGGCTDQNTDLPNGSAPTACGSGYVCYGGACTQQYVEYSIPTASSSAQGITSAGGLLWFTEQAGHKIASITTGGAIHEYALSSGSDAYDITAGSDGNVWFTQTNDNYVTHFSPSNPASQTWHVLPTAGSYPAGIASGASDGNVWFAANGINQVGVISTSSYAITQLNPPVNACGVSVEAFALANDGHLWFTESFNGYVGRINPGSPLSATTFTEYSIDTALGGSPGCGYPRLGITALPDSSLWMSGLSNLVRFPLPSGPPALVAGTPSTGWAPMTAGSDGHVWLAAIAGVQRVSASGTVQSFGTNPASFITPGPDGNIWFTETSVNKIGRIIPPYP